MNSTMFWKGLLLGCVCSSLVLAVSTAIAGTGVGAVFNLGASNSVNATTALQGTTSGTQLAVVNHGAGPAVYGSGAASAGVVRGVNTATTGSGSGLAGSASSPAGVGVFGNAAANAFGSTNYGVMGQSAGGFQSAGVFGQGSASGIGVLGKGGGVGVSGVSTDGDGVSATSTTGRAVAGFNASTTSPAIVGGNTKGSGVTGNSTSATWADFRAGVYGIGNADPGGYFTSGQRTGVVAVGPGDAGHQGGPGNGVDAGSASNGASGVYAHWDGSTGHGYGLFATAPSGSEAAHIQGDIHVTGDINADHGMNGMIPYRIDFNAPRGSPEQGHNLGTSLTVNLFCEKDAAGDTYFEAYFWNNSGQGGSMNWSGIDSHGRTDSHQWGVPNGSYGGQVISGSSHDYDAPGLRRMEVGQWVYRVPGETISGPFDFYTDDTHCEFYSNAIRIH